MTDGCWMINLPACYLHAGYMVLCMTYLSRTPPWQLVNPDIESADEVLVKDAPVCILPGICNAAEYGASRSA